MISNFGVVWLRFILLVFLLVCLHFFSFSLSLLCLTLVKASLVKYYWKLSHVLCYL